MTRTQERTLAFCNRIRVALGKKPRKTLAKGVRGKPRACPIARTLGIGFKVYPDRIDIHDVKALKKLQDKGFVPPNDHKLFGPAYITNFVDTFDNGRYPELIA